MNFKNLYLVGGLLFVGILPTLAQQKGNHQDVKLASRIDSVSYSIGISVGQNMSKDGLDSLDIDILAKGIRASLHHDSLLVNMQQAQGIIQSYVQTCQSKKSEGNKMAGIKFLEENKSKPGVTTTPSGLQYKILKAGSGAIPKLTDTVTTHYHGTLIDGTVFDSSVERGQPASFPVAGVIPGWTEALQMMPVGSKWQLVIPSNLAYGDRATAGGKIQPGSTLVFEVELLEIKNGR